MTAVVTRAANTSEVENSTLPKWAARNWARKRSSSTSSTRAMVVCLGAVGPDGGQGVDGLAHHREAVGHLLADLCRSAPEDPLRPQHVGDVHDAPTATISASRHS